MAKNDGKILFITPGATSVGGNIFLLHFLRWFKQNSKIPFLTLYGYGGDLEKDFAALSKTYRFDLHDKTDHFFKKSVKKISEQFGINRQFIKTRIRQENIRLIYSNAVINNEMLSIFAGLDVPVISHCHELESVIYLTGIEGFRETKKRTNHFIAVSDAVRRNLIENHAIAPEDITLIYAFIPLEDFSPEEISAKRANLCKELNIPQNAFIVGASGSLNWRKAPEIFIRIATAVSRKMPDAPIFFVWIGGAEKGDFAFFEVNYDIEKLGLKNKVFFLEHKSNPLDYYAALDVFAMVSREEPLGLVCVEAGSLGKPIICFADAGGAVEIVGADAGFIVPYFDTEIFAEKILELYKKPSLKEKMGKNAAERIRANHDILISAPEILKIIEKYLNQ